jgi:hypothetical protein
MLLKYGCHSDLPQNHPWHKEVEDVACGYENKLLDDLCRGCHRARAEDPLDQLSALDERHTEDGIA